MNKLVKQQLNLKKILWGSLLASNFMIAFVVWLNLMNLNGSIVLYEGLQQLPYILACVLSIISYAVFHFATSASRLKDQFKNISTELSLNTQMTPQMFEEYKSMSDTDKKKYILNNKLLALMVLSWSLAEAVNIIGMMSIYMFGMEANNYFVFLGMSVVLMLVTYPKEIELPSY